jgi:hypothetical protein
MSIINEALKKASKEVSGAEQWKLDLRVKQESAQKRQEPSISPRTSGISWKTVFIALFLCLCAVVIAATWYDWKQMERQKASVIPEKIVEAVKTPQILPKVSSKKHARPKKKIKIPDLKLSGIMMEYPPSALVNGQFVGVGDELEGAVVLEIHKDHVVFEFHGQKFKRSIY